MADGVSIESLEYQFSNTSNKNKMESYLQSKKKNLSSILSLYRSNSIFFSLLQSYVSLGVLVFLVCFVLFYFLNGIYIITVTRSNKSIVYIVNK